MAKNLNSKICGRCGNNFDDAMRCPRIFKCFHTLCHDCIGHLIKKDKKQCPFCNKKFKAKFADNIMINQTLLELIRYMDSQESSSHMQRSSSQRNSSSEIVHRPPAQAPLNERINPLKEETKRTTTEHLVTCCDVQSHTEDIIFKIARTQEVLTKSNNLIKSEILPKVHNMTIRNNTVSEELEQIKSQLHEQLQTLKGKSKQLQDLKTDLEASTGDTFLTIACLVNKAEEANNVIVGWVDDCKNAMKRKDEIRLAREKEAQTTNRNIELILDILNSSGETKKVITSPIIPANSVNVDLQLIKGDALLNMNDSLKALVSKGKFYARQQHTGRRAARISFDVKNRLCIHHLREEQLPSNARFIQHSEAMALVDTNSRLAFLELGIRGVTLGRLYIRLAPETKRANNFSLLCTAELGPSYVDTNVLGIDNKGQNTEFICCGDYEANDGSKGMALVPKSGEEVGGLYERPWLPGSLEGGWEYRADDKAAQFLIHTHKNPGVMLDAAFGIIEEGLDELKNMISTLSNICDVQIKDCGLVLNCSESTA